MSEWRKYKLNEVYDFSSGLSKPRSDFGFGYGFLSYKDIFHNYFVPENLNELVNSTLKEQKSCSIQRGDVFLTRTSETDEDLGKSCVALKDYPEATFNGFTKRLRPNGKVDILPEFAGFFFRTPGFRASVSGISSITTRASLNNEMLSSLDIVIPSIEEQETIVQTLKSLHDKIDLLQRQKKTLEALAETLFRYWFMTETLDNSTKLGDYVISANTGLDAIKRAPIVNFETGLKCLRIQDVSQGKIFEKWGNSKVEENNFKKFQLKRDDIIMARTCSPGINLFIREDLPAVFNNGLVRIRANKDKVHPLLLNSLFNTREFIGHIDGISGGTSVQLNMQVGDLLSYEISFPPIEKQNEVIEHFKSIDNKLFLNQNQINILTKLRDTLLPKLMSGEVRIKN